MRLMDIPTRVSPWTDLSRQTLRAAMDPQRAAEALALLQQVADRWPDHLADIALGWIDTVAQAQGMTEYGPGRAPITGIGFTTPEEFLNPRPVSDAERWAFDLLAARMTWDQAGFLRLFVEARTTQSLGSGMTALMWCAGYTLAQARAGAL